MPSFKRRLLPILIGLALCGTMAFGAFTINNPNGTGPQPYHLPDGTTGVQYTPVTLSTTGALGPLVWGVNLSFGSFPTGLQLDSSSGTIFGTPTAPGTYNFQIQCTDATGAVATANFIMTVLSGPLKITSQTPFDATVGSPYAYTLTATGGTPPYSWSITSGSIAPLTLNPGNGVISGTPTTPGTLNFTVQVKDNAAATATQALSIVVHSQPLVISTPTTLPPASVGQPYTQTISASGGVTPYAWSIVSGAVPGLTLDPASGILSGTPTSGGNYSPRIQVADAAGTTTARTFSLSVTSAVLTITTQSPLPNGTAGQPYTQTLTASGGVPPYTWTATGLPNGLSLNATTGVISGTLLAAGSFPIPVRVTDSTPNSVVTLLQLTVALPPVPNISLTGIPGSSKSTTQIPVQVTLDQPYQSDITGQVSLAFAPAITGANDPSIQFNTGGTTASYTIPAGQTQAFTSSPVSFQTGTLAGTITVSASANAYTVPQTVAPQNVTIPPSPPVISNAVLNVFNSQTIVVTAAGYSNTRDMTTAAFTFSASGNNQLQTSQFTVQVATPFANWFKDPTINTWGSQFSYSQAFGVTGDVNAIVLQSVTLTNSQGASAAFSPGH
jgi:hypothetical protein